MFDLYCVSKKNYFPVKTSLNVPSSFTWENNPAICVCAPAYEFYLSAHELVSIPPDNGITDYKKLNCIDGTVNQRDRGRRHFKLFVVHVIIPIDQRLGDLW